MHLNLDRKSIRSFMCAAFLLLVCVSGASKSQADLSIVTPSSTILQPKQLSAEGIFGLDRGSHFGGWLNGSINFVEFEGAQLSINGQSATVASIQAQLLPETSQTPSASIGVRDIFDTTHHFGSLGYGGRSLYAVVGKKVPGLELLPGPLHNLAYTIGVGSGVTNGAFASETSDLTGFLHQTLEYDGKGINYRLSLAPDNSNVRLEYDRIHSVDFIGLRIQSPSVSLFDPF